MRVATESHGSERVARTGEGKGGGGTDSKHGHVGPPWRCLCARLAPPVRPQRGRLAHLPLLHIIMDQRVVQVIRAHQQRESSSVDGWMRGRHRGGIWASGSSQRDKHILLWLEPFSYVGPMPRLLCAAPLLLHRHNQLQTGLLLVYRLIPPALPPLPAHPPLRHLSYGLDTAQVERAVGEERPLRLRGGVGAGLQEEAGTRAGGRASWWMRGWVGGRVGCQGMDSRVSDGGLTQVRQKCGWLRHCPFCCCGCFQWWPAAGIASCHPGSAPLRC